MIWNRVWQRVRVRLWAMDIDPTVTIEAGVYLDRTWPKGIHIGANTKLELGSVILTHDMTRGLFLETSIGQKCVIGARSIIMPGVRLGDGVIVLPGSVVTKDMPPYSACAGNPAVIVHTIPVQPPPV